MLILTALLMFISWVNPIIATAISREGGRMPIAKYIPVSAAHAALGEALRQPDDADGAAILLMGIAVAVLLGTHSVWALCWARSCWRTCLASRPGCVALTIDASRPILHWQTEQQVDEAEHESEDLYCLSCCWWR